MKRILSLALLLSAVAAHADLYGVKLVSWTPSLYTEGNGTLGFAYGGGVTMTGLIAQQLDSVSVVYSPPPDRNTPPPYASQYGIVRLSAQVVFNVFWLDSPPPTLYLNLWEAGDAYATASRGTPGGTVMDASATAAPVWASVTDPYPRPYSYSGTVHLAGWRKTSSTPTVSWTQVGTVNGRALYRTVNPISIQLAEVNAIGHASTTDGPCMSMSAGGGGFGYFVSDQPWP